MGLSFASLYLLVYKKPFCPAWWLGVPLAIACAVTMGSGILPPAIAVLLLLYRAYYDRADIKTNIAAAAVCAGVLILCKLLLNGGPTNASLKAESIEEFALALSIALAWPWRPEKGVGDLKKGSGRYMDTPCIRKSLTLSEFGFGMHSVFADMPMGSGRYMYTPCIRKSVNVRPPTSVEA